MSIKRYCYAFWITGSISLSCLTTTSFAQAQTIDADPTLTPNNSIVTPQPNNISEISGGLEVGRNLFHSFREFSVPKGNTAYFNNADSIQNIISRVTGGSVSNIDGLIKANGTANLFLLNPNGIIFGPNAKLDIRGSFLASTASSLVFSDGSFFSATDPQTTPLLTISIPTGLQYRTNAARIVNSSAAGLQVQRGNTLALVGGNVQLDGGILEAPAGRAELGGLAGSGTVGLRVNGNNLSLSFPDGVALADVSLTDKARVGVALDGSGHIAINARNLDISEESELLAGIGNGLGTVGTQAGNIAINATGAVTVTNSVISNNVESGATGNGGNINVKAGSLSLNNNSRLQVRTFGQGNAGSVLIQANDFVSLVNTSVLRSNVETGAEGDGGEVYIRARALSLLSGGQLQALTRGKGNAGNVRIAVQDAIKVAGEGTISGDVFPSTITTKVEGVEEAEGNGGSINITTGSLLLSDGGQLLADTNRKGNAGNNAGDIFVSASESVSLLSSTLKSPTLIRNSVGAGAVGNGGQIEIQTRSLSLAGGAQIAASVLESQDGLPGGQGKGGDILINATETVNLSGAGVRGFSSGLVAATEEGAKGSAGNITVNTGSFRIADGAVASAQTFNESYAGNITINATTFEAVNGGQILTTASSSGNAGKISVNANDSTTLSGSDFNYTNRRAEFGEDVQNEGSASGLFASTRDNSTGLGGDIAIATGQLIIRDGAEVSVSSRGKGAAGILEVNARSIRLDNQGALRAETRTGAGNITLQSQDIILRRNSEITTSATGEASGGNITINTNVLAALENSDISANAYEGPGGIIDIRAQGIFGLVQLDLEELKTLLGTEDPNELDTGKLLSSDITAISQTDPSLSGQVTINTLEVDPNRGLIELPENVVDPAALISQNPCARGSESEFTITGRGGLPPSPNDALTSEATGVGLVEPAPISSAGILPAPTEEQNSAGILPTRAGEKTVSTPSKTKAITPAQGWIFNNKGEVVLTAYNPTVTGPQRLQRNSGSCLAPWQSVNRP